MMILKENITFRTSKQQFSNINVYPNYDQLIDELIISKSQHAMIELHLFDDYEDLRLIGIIEDIDANSGIIRIDGEWFQLDKVKEYRVNI